MWKPEIHITALHHNVLVVATTRAEGAWCAYCGVVAGKNHDNEWQEVLDHGGKLSKKVAQAIFPGFAHLPYAR